MRRWHVIALAVLAALALACKGTGVAHPAPSGTRSPTGQPSSMAALGDSITAGFGSCFVLVACERRSWSTGSDASVDSHYQRIRDNNPKIRGQAHNYAEPGARAADLNGQARAAVAAKAQYITVLIGANDACARSVRDMTPVRTYRTQIGTALRTLKKGLPQSRVLVVSIPDLYRLWKLGHDDELAVRAWNTGICPRCWRTRPRRRRPTSADAGRWQIASTRTTGSWRTPAAPTANAAAGTTARCTTSASPWIW